MFAVRNRMMPPGTSADDAPNAFQPGNHSQCVALSRQCRGKLCDEFAGRPARHLAAGQFIYLMGEAARSVYLVRRGLVKTAVVSPAGQELTLRMHPPGDVFGELCLCSGERREQAVALEASEVVTITLEMLVARLRQDPVAALDLTAIACEHLAEAHDRLRSLSIDSALHRLARTLLGLAADFGEPAPDGMLVLHYITQQELARLVGARREVASSLLNRLRDRGLIRYLRRGPIAVDGKALRAFVEPRPSAGCCDTRRTSTTEWRRRWTPWSSSTMSRRASGSPRSRRPIWWSI